MHTTQLIEPDDPTYDDARAGFQTQESAPPAYVVDAMSVDDIRDGVRFAVARGLPVAVQATGHGRARVDEAGVLINTRHLGRVDIDPAGRTARIGAGVRWRQVIDAAAAHGLAAVSGSSPDVGVVGYTLGGGYGILSRQFGFAADHVRRIEVVTADGTARTCTAETEAELFWALRGGRDNFGIVTEIEIDLFPLRRLYGGGLFFDAQAIPDVLDTYRTWTATLPETLTSAVGLIPYPDIADLPEALRGRRVAHVRIAFTGSHEDGERLVEPLRAIGPRLLDAVGDLPYAESGSIYRDPPHPHAYSGDNALLGELAPAAIEHVLDVTGPNAQTPAVVEFRHLGGALSRPPSVPSAVGHRDANYVARVVLPLTGAAGDGAADLQQRFLAGLTPWTVGRSVNFGYFPDAGSTARRDCYDAGDLARLSELEAQWDPSNTFRQSLQLVHR